MRWAKGFFVVAVLFKHVYQLIYAWYWRHYRCKDSPLCYFSTINLQTTFKQDINMRKQVLIHLTNRGFEGKYTDKRFKEAYRKCPSGNPALKVFWIIDYLLLNY